MKLFTKILRITIRFFELIILLSISVFIIHEISVCNDRPTLCDDINMVVVILLWIFPISIPLSICIFVSLIKSFSLKTIYTKIIFVIHQFNIVSILLLMAILPNSTEPTAKKMAENLAL